MRRQKADRFPTNHVRRSDLRQESALSHSRWALAYGILRMKREGTIGVAALLAIAAVAGFSLQTGPRPEETGSTDRSGAVRRSKPAPTKSETRKERPGCGSLQEELEEFLDVKGLILPEECYEPGDAPRKELQPDVIEKSSRLKFVIATLPDPA